MGNLKKTQSLEAVARVLVQAGADTTVKNQAGGRDRVKSLWSSYTGLYRQRDADECGSEVGSHCAGGLVVLVGGGTGVPRS